MGEKKGKHILKSLVIALVSVGMITGFVVLFIAASKDRNKSTCRGLVIHITGDHPKAFVDKTGIEDLLKHDKNLNPVSKPLNTLNMEQLEKSVKTFPWVKDAQLYVDNDNLLQVNITERIPIARVFTESGNSFYLDEEGTRLPVNGNFATRLPVFTGFPGDTAQIDSADSRLVAQMIAMSDLIAQDAFWDAQIDQININAHHEFELIPAVGNALIELGDGTDIQEKLDNLLVFYKKGLNNVGWGYYDTIDLQYKGQIVATRKKQNEVPVVDSLLTQNSYLNTGEETPETTRAQVPSMERAMTPAGAEKKQKGPSRNTLDGQTAKALYPGAKK